MSSNNFHVCLMGRLRSGKDTIADHLPAKKLALADPLVVLAKCFFGEGYDKTTPGYRDFLRRVGQYGRGLVNDQYPLSIERASFVSFIRSRRFDLPDLPIIEWRRYGRRESFWAELLWARVCGSADPTNIVVSDVRFEVDKNFLEEKGFQSYLVLCSESTRWERCKTLGEIGDGRGLVNPATEHYSMDVSEQYVTYLTNHLLHKYLFSPTNPVFPLDRVIWNDDYCPQPPEHLQGVITPHQFVNSFKE